MLINTMKDLMEKYDNTILTLPNGGITITSVKYVPEGEHSCEFEYDPDHLIYHTKGFVSIQGAIHGCDKEATNICFEVAVPDDWNGKLIQIGGGGFNGIIRPCHLNSFADIHAKKVKTYVYGRTMEDPTLVSDGYAVCSTDSGHKVKFEWDASWALNPEVLRNHAFEHLKKTREAAAFLVSELHGKLPEMTYFFGGSEGGREALEVVQRYSEDYNGVICFFPGVNLLTKGIKDFFVRKTLLEDNGAAWLSPDDRAYVKQVASDVCDGDVNDWKYALERKGEIFEKLALKLTPAQIKGLRALTDDMYLPYPVSNGVRKIPGYLTYLGIGLDSLYTSSPFETDGEMMRMGSDTVQYIIMRDPSFDTNDFDVEKCKEKIIEASELLDATNPDISAFKVRGGKLIILHGMEDEVITPVSTIDYYESLQAKFGDKLDDYVRLYLIPGYGHNSGRFIVRHDFIKTLENWVKNDVVPEELIIEDAIPENNGRTIPIYPYPGYPHYKGSGDKNKAENYYKRTK